MLAAGPSCCIVLLSCAAGRLRELNYFSDLTYQLGSDITILWPFNPGVASRTWTRTKCMGWAPTFLFTGPQLWFFCLCHLPIWLIYNPCNWFLLDNVPLNLGLQIFGPFLVYTSFGKFWELCDSSPPTWSKRDTRTTTRSQFRALCISKLLVISLAFNIAYQSQICTVRSEGYVISMDDVRAVQDFTKLDTWHTAKQHGLGSRKIFESYQTSKIRAVCKRSYIRARKRASLHGHTWYRGQLFTASQLGVTVSEPSDTPPPKNVPPPKYVQRRRLTCFSWNCSGLPPEHWDFLMMWLDSQSIDILLLQETHWPFTRDWISDHYLVVHSGENKKQAGLLCLISKKVCRPSNLSWYEHVPGRILQLRIHGTQRCIDILNVYQHTCIPSHMDARQQIWHNLFSILSTFSHRNILLMAGDFNCSADQRTDAIGFPMFQTDTGHSHGPRHADAHHLKHLLSQFDLTALNTWDIQNRATYEFGQQSLRIDFICTRRSHADKMAKEVKRLRDFPLVPMTGAFHIPLMTTIRNDWYPDHRPQKHGWTRQQRLQLHQHCVQQDHIFHSFNAQLQETILSIGHNTDSDLMALHRTLQQFTGDCFLTESSQLKCKTDVGPSRRFQAHTKQLRLVTNADLKGLFNSWYHVVHRCKARRDMSLASKQSRQRRLDQVFQTADRAAKAKDHFQLFQTIRTLAPKQPMKRIMLRSMTGELLGPDEAADWLHQWYHEIYSDQVDTSDMSPFDWPFSIQEFANSLQTLPTNKALAPGFTPSPFWKYGAESIAEFLDPMLHECSRVPSFPDVWGMGSLALLVKPGKTGRHPSELRPIALLEPTGKAAMGLLNTAIQQQIGHTLNHLPQFAYAKGRGTEDAIHRLAHHCRQVREALGQFSHPVHNMKNGIVLPPLLGGMTLCLDLTRAFDTVRRSHLYQGMERLGVTSDLISFLQSVYNKTTYEFEHRGTTRTVKTSRGIRQGCRAAPCLWTVFISALMMEFANQTSMSFLLLCITIFADDICSHQMFHSEESFINLLNAFGTLLDLIETAKLELNLAKTTVTLRMKGRLAEKLQRRFVLRTNKGAFLKVPRSNGTYTKIKLVKSFKYLGVQLSYYNFERETMALRLRHSEQTSHQLHRWLYTQRMNVQHRTHLWFQCTFTCLRYGIIATGFTDVVDVLSLLHPTVAQNIQRTSPHHT